MKTMSISRKIRLNDSFEIIVAGGGPSGCAAAAAAARKGKKTLLIEATGCPGGMGTAGLVPSWCPFSDGEKIIYRGIAQEVFDQSKTGQAHVDPEKTDWVPIDPEALKIIYDRLLLDAGVKIRFHSFVCSLEKNGDDTVSTLIVADKAGLSAYSAKIFIDCTGDGDLCAWAGAEFEQGNPEGELQPGTLCFSLSNVDSYAYAYGSRPNYRWLKQNVSYEKYPMLTDMHVCNNFTGPDTVGFNAGHIWDLDGTKPEQLSKAMIEGRRIAVEFRNALAEYYPKAFANSHVVNTATLMGIRETRRIVGDYVLSIEDYLARKSFPDEICRNSYPVDIHTARNEIKKAQAGATLAMRYEAFKAGESHGIPYRCLTPKGLKNVLVAGRCISTDREVQGSTRVMPVCLCMGEAAGTAAAIAVDSITPDIHTVDTALLRRELRKNGAYLPD